MKRTFLGTVKAIGPTETSGYTGGRNEVTLVAYSAAEMGDCNSTFKPSLTHEETRELGALFGKQGAVRITIETDAATGRVPTRDDAKPGEYYAHGSGNVYRRGAKEGANDLIAEVYGNYDAGSDDYSRSCIEQAQRIASLLNGTPPSAAGCAERVAAIAAMRSLAEAIDRHGASNEAFAAFSVASATVHAALASNASKSEHAAVALLKEVLAFADTKEMLHDHTGAVNWLLDFSRRSDVLATAGAA